MIKPVQPVSRIPKELPRRNDEGKSMLQKRRKLFKESLVESLSKGNNFDKSI